MHIASITTLPSSQCVQQSINTVSVTVSVCHCQAVSVTLSALWGWVSERGRGRLCCLALGLGHTPTGASHASHLPRLVAAVPWPWQPLALDWGLPTSLYRPSLILLCYRKILGPTYSLNCALGLAWALAQSQNSKTSHLLQPVHFLKIESQMLLICLRKT